MDASQRALTLTVAPGRTDDLIAAFGPWLLAGARVYCLDGGNVFDCNGLARWLRARGADLRAVFQERIFLSRAFTCHQLAAAVDELLFPLVERAGVEPIAALVLGVETLFLDEDIRLTERRYLFSRILRRANTLADRGLPLLLTCTRGAPNPWTRQLTQQTRALPDLRRVLPALEAFHQGDQHHGENLADL